MIKRREFVQLGASALGATALGLKASAEILPPEHRHITRAIPSSGEKIPVIGMGTSRTFDTPDDPDSLGLLTEVMKVFFANGGTKAYVVPVAKTDGD